jgi:3-(3-hydroxy-phenyl)propionate hydroxylase
MTIQNIAEARGTGGPQEQSTGVLIVGGGPVGLTFANLLAQFGIEAVVVEQNATLSDGPKALMLDDEYFRLLDTLGLADEVKQHSSFPVGLRWYSLLGFQIAQAGGVYTANRFATRSAAWQPALEQALYRNIGRSSSVSVRFRHALETFVERDDGIHATVKDENGRSSGIRAQYIVGADGACSAVRKILDIDFEGTTLSEQRHVVVDVADDPDGDLFGKLILDPRQPSTSLPLPYHGRRYEFKIGSEVDTDAILEDSAVRRLISVFRDPSDLKVIRKTVYTFHGRLAKQFQKGRAFLIGDAAHAMPPFGSQGLNSGGRDANNLAWKLALVLTGRAGADLLATYDTERRRQVADTVAMAVRQSRIANTGSFAKALLRDFSFGALNLVPAVKRHFAQLRYMPRQYVRSGFLIGQATSDSRDVLGGVLAQPDVRDAGKDAVLLDRVLGSSFAVVAIAPDAAHPPRGADHPVWRRLGANFIALRRPATAPASLPGFHDIEVVSAHLDDVLDRYRGKILIVRPDRLVAAAVAPDGLADAAARFADLLGHPVAGSAPVPLVA